MYCGVLTDCVLVYGRGHSCLLTTTEIVSDFFAMDLAICLIHKLHGAHHAASVRQQIGSCYVVTSFGSDFALGCVLWDSASKAIAICGHLDGRHFGAVHSCQTCGVRQPACAADLVIGCDRDAQNQAGGPRHCFVASFDAEQSPSADELRFVGGCHYGFVNPTCERCCLLEQGCDQKMPQQHRREASGSCSCFCVSITSSLKLRPDQLPLGKLQCHQHQQVSETVCPTSAYYRHW